MVFNVMLRGVFRGIGSAMVILIVRIRRMSWGVRSVGKGRYIVARIGVWVRSICAMGKSTVLTPRTRGIVVSNNF